MKEINFDPNLSYKEIILIIEVLRVEYKDILASFSLFEMKNKTLFMRRFKDQIYSLKFEEWKRNKLWEYLNGDEDYETIILFSK